MGPIRRSSKRKAEAESSGQPAAAEAEARGGKPIRFILRSSDRHRPPPTPRASAPQAHQIRGRRRQRMPRRVYRFLADLSSSDAKHVDRGPQLTTGKDNSAILALAAHGDIEEIAAMAPGNPSNEISDKSASSLNERANNDDTLLGPACPDLLVRNENDKIQHNPRYFPEEKVREQNAVELGQSSLSLLSQPSLAGFGPFEYDPKFCPSSPLEVSSSWMIAIPSVPRTGNFQASLSGAFGQLRPHPQCVPVVEIQSLIPDFDSTEGSKKAFTDKMTCYKRGKNIVDVNVKETRKSVVTSEALINPENDKGKEVRNDATSSGLLLEVNTTTCIDSTPLKYWKGLQGSSVPEIIDVPVGIVDLDQENYIGAQQHATEFSFMSDNPGDADVFLSNFPTQYGNSATETDKCATSMEQDISEESFEQYLVRSDGDNDDLLPPVKSCQAISHDHHPSEDNVAAMMECKTRSVVATESVSVMPLAMINDVVPNLLPSNATSDTCKEDHQGDTGLLGTMAAIEQPSTDSLFSAISLPALKGDIINTQSPNKNIAAEGQQGVSLEDHNSSMTEYTAESSQSIGHSAVNQLFNTYLRNSAIAEHGNRLTSPEDTDSTPSKCVASGPDDPDDPLLQRSLVHASTITDQPSESFAIESQPFLKTLPLWEQIEEMEIFKKVPQRPHFRPFKKLGPELCESMALGLMVFFSKTAENIRNLNIQDDDELFKEKSKGLSLLEEHGFDVRPLRSRLETLLNLKNSRCELRDTIKLLEEKITLKETDGQQRHAQIRMLYTAIRQLERQANIFRCILKSSVSEQNTDALEVSSLKTEACDLEQSYLSVEEQFSSVVAAPW